jgi:hypothetical protein
MLLVPSQLASPRIPHCQLTQLHCHMPAALYGVYLNSADGATARTASRGSAMHRQTSRPPPQSERFKNIYCICKVGRQPCQG